MQLVPQCFHDQTDQRICNGIRRWNLIEANTVIALPAIATGQLKLTRAQTSRILSIVAGKVAKAKNAQKPVHSPT
jgi:hypothetical protein